MSDKNVLTPVVFVVEDDDSVRTAVIRMLRLSGMDARGYASAGEFLFREREDVPSCIVLDIALPGISGLELQSALADAPASPAIVFLTGQADVDKAVRAMKAGAVDLLCKPVRREVLVNAVQRALGRNATERAHRERMKSLQTRYERLTPREQEVFALLAGGALNKQVASDLNVSVRTIKLHRAELKRKMEVTSIADLVRIADELSVPTKRGAVASPRT